MNWKFPYYDVESGIDWDSIEKEFGWFRDMKAVPQDAIWHSEGDVQIHTKMVCEAIIGLPEFKALSEQGKHIMFTSALMHDIEKRSTTREEERDGRICVVAPKHANKGEYTARGILYRDIPTPYDVRETICKVVRYHGIPLWSVDDHDSEERVIEASLMVRNELLAMIAKADILGRVCHDNEEQLEKIEFFTAYCQELGCWDKPKEFASDLGRHKYLTEGGWAEFNPYDETKFDVVMMCGVAGSGKDTYINNELPVGLHSLSIDDIRRENDIKRSDKKGSGQAIQMAKEQAREYMRKKASFVFNATNLTRDMRSKWISLFKEYGGKVIIRYIEVPYETLLNQNKNREHVVPEAAIEKMIDKLEIPEYNEAHEVYYITR